MNAFCSLQRPLQPKPPAAQPRAAPCSPTPCSPVQPKPPAAQAPCSPVQPKPPAAPCSPSPLQPKPRAAQAPCSPSPKCVDQMRGRTRHRQPTTQITLDVYDGVETRDAVVTSRREVQTHSSSVTSSRCHLIPLSPPQPSNAQGQVETSMQDKALSRAKGRSPNSAELPCSGDAVLPARCVQVTLSFQLAVFR